MVAVCPRDGLVVDIAVVVVVAIYGGPLVSVFATVGIALG